MAMMTSAQPWLQLLWPDSEKEPSAIDFLYTFWIAFAFLALRVVTESIGVRILRPLLERVKPGLGKTAEHIFDDFFIAACGVVLEVWAIYITLYHNGECKPWNTRPCLDGWPNHPVHAHQKWYFILCFQYYMYEMMCTALGTGTVLKTDMFIHHIVTMGLIGCAYCVNLMRFGTMWQALFDISNPFLHAAKMLNSMQGVPAVETPKWCVFITFAIMFFFARVAIPPFAVVYPAVTRSLLVVPAGWAYFFMALMVLICGLQWMWFHRIIRLALGAGKKKEQKAE